MLIDLSRPETELLAGLLEREFDEIRSELHHTRGHEFKEGLKQREALVRELLARLAA